jgi:hypothetical protein
MHGERAVLLHPSLLQTPWHVAFVLAAFDVLKHLALTFAVMAGGAVLVVLALLLAVVAAPLALALAAWVLWRSSLDGSRAVKRAVARTRRRARRRGLRVVNGARPA